MSIRMGIPLSMRKGMRMDATCAPERGAMHRVRESDGWRFGQHVACYMNASRMAYSHAGKQTKNAMANGK